MNKIKEKVWKRATTELDYDDTERNFEYEEPIMDLTLSEVEKVIDEEIKRMENLMNDPKLKMDKNSEIATKLRHYKELKLCLRGKNGNQ